MKFPSELCSFMNVVWFLFFFCAPFLKEGAHSSSKNRPPSRWEINVSICVLLGFCSRLAIEELYRN